MEVMEATKTIEAIETIETIETIEAIEAVEAVEATAVRLPGEGGRSAGKPNRAMPAGGAGMSGERMKSA
ncbi:Uncharacterised protein [Burkholderia pseudomallei]|uniref:hypothetical protein n=2 Tax=Burkholderia pseudomallei TaxID=28450 RepID=UPI0009D1900F|nr:hypothetical protein [Burkholderia pseudomallei]OND87496.1 hypothetical protein AQ942_22610 [Burkholderia pseudomallei]ONE00293.1 hypothetical protein AQ941_18890 [Burkholderia pseudomallei]CAJ2911504.1 Uncharacterised protein [Burkholderia pseudomallei]CAJ3098319.1 Uncharacterised protein [Burkholderia pseudomallei]CAJ3229117.1 Uncharacterised protein [Burkholderia pseudomallei]